jgi:hypothetical protein
VVAEADPALSHDGSGVVRIPAGVTPTAAIWTTITEPSVVLFWHRGGGLVAPVTMVAGRRVVISTDWREIRQVVMPGEFRIANDKSQPPTPLFLDEFSVTPLATVSLAEALDLPGVTVSPGSGEVAGLVDPLTAPDGEDAVYFGEDGFSSLIVSTVGPAMMVFRHGPANSSSPAVVGSPPLMRWTDDSTGFLAIPAGNTMASVQAANTSFGDLAPARVDQ